jgi:metallo-beta-lactamase family protein
VKIQFLGAAETVTGSRFLIDSAQSRILVDCGLFQGLKKLRLRNRRPFPVEPSSIQAVILTHAHIDHSGYIPALIKHGFTGRIYCTAATLDLCRILLPDSGHLQEEEAEYANRHGFSRHKPARPLYTEEDGHKALKRFEGVPFASDIEPVEGIRIRFTPNGHILGSSSVLVTDGRRRLVISGDVGRPDDPVMYPPAVPEPMDYLLVESTYGDRRHPKDDPGLVLKEAITTAVSKGGSVIIPTFAVGRAQSILYLLFRLIKTGSIPKLSLYLDSPMAINATELFYHYHDLHRLSEDECRAIFDQVTFTRTVEESKAIAADRHPKIILSASGMLTGGRVLHHLKQYLPDPHNVIVFVGFQAAGTRGANMLQGSDSVKIHGEYFPVRARLVNLESISAHADYVELGDWLSPIGQAPKQTFIVHGEPQSQDAFRLYLKDRFGWQVEIPSQGDSYDLD